MNLSKRSVLVIIPVIFFCFLLAAIASYKALEKTIVGLERSQVENATSEAASRYTQYSTFVESYLSAILYSTALREFLTESDHVYRQVGLGSAIEETLRGFSEHESDQLSLLIVDLEQIEKEIYYFELSNDPFASLNPALRKHYETAILAPRSQGPEFIEIDNAPGLISVNRKIDKSTFFVPPPQQTENIALIQLSMRPNQFHEKIEEIKKDYLAHVSLDSGLDEQNFALIVRSNLGSTLTLEVGIPHDYLQQRLLPVKVALAAISLLLFVLTSLLLLRLVNRYVTGPIENLESELTEVISKRKGNITIHHSGKDEVGRLERTFHKLYGDLSAAYKKTKELAEHDPLTKLHNLNFVTEKMNAAIQDAKEKGEQLALIYIDLDNFKFVNDKYGHEIGDELLKAFAARLTRIVRSNDLVCENASVDATHARIAGDEFSVIVRHIHDTHIPERIARRILGIFSNGFHFEKGSFPVTASIGIAMYPQDGHTLSQLVSNADNAMYQAKASGKNCLAFYSQELANRTRRRLEIEQELKSLNPDDEFYLVYMSLNEASTLNTIGFETLIRWQSPKLGFVGPDEFIPIAEACGLFEKIDSWVCGQAIRDYPRLREAMGEDFKLSINLSSAQLNIDKIGEQLINLTRQHKVKPKCIQLELTETLGVEFSSRASKLLQFLCNHGFSIAIDDFGSGYTALQQLLEYPAQMIKFDKAFVDKALSADGQNMLEPLIELCHSRSMQVTIEGVETEEMASIMRDIGADYLQGYHFGKPVRLQELPVFETAKS